MFYKKSKPRHFTATKSNGGYAHNITASYRPYKLMLLPMPKSRNVKNSSSAPDGILFAMRCRLSMVPCSERMHCQCRAEAGGNAALQGSNSEPYLWDPAVLLSTFDQLNRVILAVKHEKRFMKSVNLKTRDSMSKQSERTSK